jgi:hypothetical protein
MHGVRASCVILYKITFLLTFFIMKGNIMDKKILLSGAAALLVAGSLYSAPASASAIELSFGGEATFDASMNDRCRTAAADSASLFAFLDTAPGIGADILSGGAEDSSDVDTDIQDLEADLVALGHAAALDLTTSIDNVDDVEYETTNATVTAENATSEGLQADGKSLADLTIEVDYKNTTASHSAGETVVATDTVVFASGSQVNEMNSLDDVSFNADPCAGANEANPIWGYGKEITIAASGTLANGLSVTFEDKIDLTGVAGEEGAFDLTLSGAFGDLRIKDGASSAVDAVVLTNFDTSILTGQKAGGDARGRMYTETAANGGTGFLYTLPGMGGVDFHIGWTPRGDDGSTDATEYENILSFGASMSMDSITIAAGMEQANSDTNTATTCIAGPGAGIISGDAQTIYNAVYGGDLCGDQTLTYLGAKMSVADMTLNGGWQKLDTDEADVTIYGLKAATSVGDYNISATYHNNTLEYALGNVEDTQSAIGVALSTDLGDGVSFGVNFATNDADMASQSTTVGGLGSENNYAARARLTVGF